MTFTRLGVAATVRAEMARRGLVQRHLADVLGISQQSMGMRLRGRTPFTVDQMLSLADFFDVPVSVLMEEPSPPERTDAPPTRRAPAQAIPA